MLHVSLGELEITYRAAFLAMGFERGAAVDAARMLLWLDVEGARGLARLVPRLDGLRLPRSPLVAKRDERTITIDAEGASVLAIGPAAADLGLAEHRAHGLAQVRMLNASDIEFAGALARILLARRFSARLRWGPFELDAWGVIMIAGGGVHGPRPDWERLVTVASPATLEITFGDHSRGRAPSAPSSLPDGLCVVQADWQALNRVASRMLVPESEKSRQEGAGIGADED